MYTTKDFTHLIGLAGFSDTMLNNHLTLYKGYVDNSNKLVKLLDTLEKGSYEYYECKRRLAWELNGIKLHELYFENISTSPTSLDIATNIKAKIVSTYGDVDKYFESLRRNGMIRGIGWVLLMQDNKTSEIFHTFVSEHSGNVVIDAKILLVMDMWEHAYMTDYGIKKADYIESFIKAIDWNVVEGRLTQS